MPYSKSERKPNHSFTEKTKQQKEKVITDKNEWAAIVIGAGPCGIAAAAELKKKGIESLIIEKGAVTESIRQYPKRMTFFSTAENIEIAGIPFPTSNVKASRNEALQYYRKVSQYFDLNFKLNTAVQKVERTGDNFTVHTSKGNFISKFVVLATGYFDKPRMLNIPGEDLPRVSHYYKEPYAHSFQKVVIVGGGNSGIEAALELYRHNVDVTMVVRGADIKPTAKYWLVPDIKNRIKEGKINVIFNAEATAVREGEIDIVIKNGEKQTLETDFIYMLVGYHTDAKLLTACGLHPNPENLLIDFDESTYQSEIENLYLCGTVLAGIHTEKVFIENGREHAKTIAAAVARKTETVLND